MAIFDQNTMRTFRSTNPVSFVMIILITTVYFLQVFLLPLGIDLASMGAIRTFDIVGPTTAALNTEYYRLITAIFLHGSFLHYLFNTLFGFFIIGASLERLIGSKKYLIALIVSGLGSSAIVYGWEYISFVYFNSGRIVQTLGASGAIFGTMGFLFYLTLVRPHWFSPQDISSIRGIILLNVVFSFFGNISTSGHLGGLATGFIAALILTGKQPYYKKSKGFENPYDPYNYEEWDLEDIEDVVFVDDEDDDDDRRVW